MSLLHIHSATIAYRSDAVVLRDVKLDIAAGEAVAILGGNGAGKTALLHWIAGVLPRGKGERSVGGRTIDSTRDAVSAGIGLVVQDPNDQLLGATVIEDVELGPHNLGLSDLDIATRSAEALQAVAMTHHAHRDTESLSFGERKRASLAGVLAMRPRLLLLDEPTAGLDPVGEREFCDTLRVLAASGTALVVATHAVDLVPRFATRVIVLGEGHVLADGECRDVLVRTDVLARSKVRTPWPVELWERSARLRKPGMDLPLTLDDVLTSLERC